MPRRPLLAPPLALACVLACSDDPAAPIEYLEHCGATGPVRILDLEPGQALGSARLIGDRLYYYIGSLDLTNPFGPVIAERSLWSSGPCGESPVHLVDDTFFPFFIDRWPDLPLICLNDTGIVALDPNGAEPPRLVFPAEGCQILGWSDHGLLNFTNIDDDAKFADLQLTPYPDDPQNLAPPPITLAERVLLSPRQQFNNTVYVLTEDATLARIDVADGTTTPVQANVTAFELTDDEGYLVWQDADTGLVSLRDNNTTNSVALGTTKSLYFELGIFDTDLGVLVFADRLFFLPEFTVVDLPTGYRVVRVGPDRTFALLTPEFGGTPGLRRIELGDGKTTTLFRSEAQFFDYEDDALLLLDMAPCCGTGGHSRDEAAAWRVPFDGTPARRLADRASKFVSQPDTTSLVTLVDIDESYLGTLIHVDTATRGEQVIDDHVIANYPHDTDPSIITYAVNDGARSGIYTARFATTP